LVLNILEGEAQEVHQPIPIGVNVNAVFSKYSITPLKTINFGPMQYGEQVTRTFEVRNEGLFEFKYAICDDNDFEAKARIKEERQKEQEERISGAQEAAEADPKAAAKGAKKPDPKAAKGGKAAAGKEGAPADGTQLTVGQYDVTPATGSIPPGNAAVVSVTFRAEGAKFYESTLAVDIAERDPQDQPDGVPFELCAESSIPGLNTDDLDQVFEEQTVIPSLDPSLNTQTIISSSLYSIQERVFWFGTLVASKNPEGAKERFKIMNPNKIPCTVKFAVKPRSQSKSEGFAFEVSPDSLTIDPHKHKYVTVGFMPTAMMTYGGIFEAVVETGDPESKSGKLVCELRGEGTLPTLLVERPEEVDSEGTPVLRFRKTRIGREATMQIVLKNEGQVPATARFDALQHDCFTFMGNLSHTITPKSYHAFDIQFTPKQAQSESFLLTFSTLSNPYEQHKVQITGEGYSESVTFEGLPEDELAIGDCVVGKQKTMAFQLANNGDKAVRFHWNVGDKEEFRLYPTQGHLKAHSTKEIKVAFKATKAVSYDQIELACDTVVIEQKASEDAFKDWDDTMKTIRMVRPSELKKIMAERDAEERRRREEAEAAAAAAKGGKPGAKGGKPPAKKEDGPEADMQIDESEEATAELIDTIPEPEHEKAEGSERSVALKTSLVCDYARYECTTTRLEFKPTLMYAQRTHKFTIKNTSLINLQFNFKLTNPESGILDAGAYSIFPKKGSIAPGCDDNFLVKFAPMEIENDFTRLICANFQHLDPEQQPLEITAQGIAERPVIHFELPPSAYRERKEKDMTPVDSKYKIIEFDSLGTSIRNTRRFMTVNPTAQGYEFEWEEVPDETKKQKPLFKCLTQRGIILSGKKAEMVFEYIPDTVGEHESQWIFRIPAENIVQHFLVVGRVNEPNVLFETGKIKFGPLLLGGKNREVVSLINQEHIPFSFNFGKESVKGSPDFGDSLKVSPMSGVVPAQS
jgi:hydrocephalus-inducing protein